MGQLLQDRMLARRYGDLTSMSWFSEATELWLAKS
jgi:hypothetical protein